jgi:hypothetical protein
MARIPSAEAAFMASLEIEGAGVRLVPEHDDSGHRVLSVYLDNGCGGHSLFKSYRHRANAISVANLLAGARRVKDRKAQTERRGKSGR